MEIELHGFRYNFAKGKVNSFMDLRRGIAVHTVCYFLNYTIANIAYHSQVKKTSVTVTIFHSNSYVTAILLQLMPYASHNCSVAGKF